MLPKSKINLKRSLRVFLFQLSLIFLITLANTPKTIALDLKYIKEKAFFFKDIHNFHGKLFKSKTINKDYSIQQTFQPSCNQLNRLIIPFYFENPAKSENLIFNLFKTSNLEKPLFTDSINPYSWGDPLKLGGFKLYGKFHYIWIPPIKNSKNQSFTFEIKSGADNSSIGIYLNRSKNPQLSPIQVNGQELSGIYTGIFSYCKTSFDLKEITQTILERMGQEKIFFIFYILGIVALILAIKCTGKNIIKPGSA